MRSGCRDRPPDWKGRIFRSMQLRRSALFFYNNFKMMNELYRSVRKKGRKAAGALKAIREGLGGHGLCSDRKEEPEAARDGMPGMPPAGAPAKTTGARRAEFILSGSFEEKRAAGRGQICVTMGTTMGSLPRTSRKKRRRLERMRSDRRAMSLGLVDSS